jgi:hypothetical protein
VKFYGLATHADGTFVEFHPYSDLVHILEYIVSELQRQARLANTCDNQFRVDNKSTLLMDQETG